VLQSSIIQKIPKFVEFRSMVFGSYWDGERNHTNALFVADAVSYHSAIYIFSDCQVQSSSQSESLSDNHRILLNTLVTTAENIGVDHTYGLAFSKNNQLYATFQHTDVVLSFLPQSLTRNEKVPWIYKAGDFPPTLQQPTTDNGNASSHQINNKRYNQPNHWYDYFPGTFYQFGKPRIQKRSAQGIRSILLLHYCSDGSIVANNDMDLDNQITARYYYNDVSSLQRKHVVKTVVWIANEDIDGILVVDQSTGLAQQILTIHNPIHLLFDGKTQRVFASSKRKHWRGAVFAIDPHAMKTTAVYTTNQMDHPTGLAIYDDVLYVGMQERAQVMKFNVKTKKYLGIAIDNIPGEIESLLLSPC
jgi:hypothetical protein